MTRKRNKYYINIFYWLLSFFIVILYFSCQDLFCAYCAKCFGNIVCKQSQSSTFKFNLKIYKNHKNIETRESEGNNVMNQACDFCLIHWSISSSVFSCRKSALLMLQTSHSWVYLSCLAQSTQRTELCVWKRL